MGVVYSSAEVLKPNFPRPGDHDTAARLVLERVGGLDTTVLTMVHGSVPEGRANLRSDLDVLVTYRPGAIEDEPLVVDGVKQILDDIGDKTGVKVEANIWPVGEHPDARRERMYDILFSHHLALSMGVSDWCVGDPDQAVIDLASLPLSPEAVRRVALNYTTYKHAGFTGAPRVFNDREKSVLSIFQRALEFPKAAGRKVGQLISLDGGGQPNDYLEALRSAEHGEMVAGHLDNLRQIDLEYTALLESFQGRTDISNSEIDDYARWLSDRYSTALGIGIIAATSFTKFIAHK